MTAADSRSAPCKRREADWRRQHVGDARKDRKGKDGQRKAEDAHDASQARQLFWGQGRGAGARSGMCLRAACGVFSVSDHSRLATQDLPKDDPFKPGSYKPQVDPVRKQGQKPKRYKEIIIGKRGIQAEEEVRVWLALGVRGMGVPGEEGALSERERCTVLSLRSN